MRTAAWLLAAFMAASPAAALAAAPADVERQQHAELGRRNAEVGRYNDAISEYRKAYELKADPEFLFAIAGCYRRLGNNERALFFYQRYVNAAPEGAHRAEADRAIAALGPAALEISPPSAAHGPLAPSLTNDVVIIPVPPPVPAPATPAEAAKRSLWRHWWVWAVVGVVVLGGAAAAWAARGDDDRAVPATALGNMRY